MKNITIVLGLFLIACIATSFTSNEDEGVRKITICHIPPGNPSNWHEITIAMSALEAHLAHGDQVGSCDPPIRLMGSTTVLSPKKDNK